MASLPVQDANEVNLGSQDSRLKIALCESKAANLVYVLPRQESSQEHQLTP